MLTFRNTNIGFLLLLAIFVGLHICYGIPWYAYALLFTAYTWLLFYGSYFVGSQFYMKTFCSGSTAKMQIAITFDDGPCKNYTPQILETLSSLQVKATFFCIGKNILQNKNILRQIYEQGHIIGNHSYCHSFWFDLFSASKMKKDLQQTHNIICEITGKNAAWFRPPYGVTNPNIAKAVKAMDYNAVGWNVRSMDTVVKDSTDLLEKMKKRLQPGAIILFHDTCKTTAEMLPAFLQYVKEQKYEIVPLDKLLPLQPYQTLT